MKTNKAILITVLSTTLLIGGCATNLQGDSYSRKDARQVQTVKYGTIEAVRLVVIEGTKTPIGTTAGAAVGGIAASSIGDGKGAAAAAVIGAVVGGLAGAAAEEMITKSQGVELVIRMTNRNDVISVVQAINADNPFNIGDRVRLMSINGQTRVTK